MSYCPVCNYDEFIPVYVGQAPVACTDLPETAVEAVLKEMYPLDIVMCRDCCHVFNRAMQEVDYEGFPMYNGGWSKHVELMARMLSSVASCERVVDIGGGDCGFLELLSKYTDGQYSCIDPNGKSDRFTVYTDYSRELLKDLSPDTVILRHTLEHFLSPRDVLRGIVSSVPPGTKFFIEVPNVEKTLDRKWFCDYMPEHPQNFTRNSLTQLMALCQLDVNLVAVENEGTVLCVLATKPEEQIPSRVLDCPTVEPLKFNFKQVFEEVDTLLGDESIIVWGAAGKGATFLNTFGVKRQQVYDSDERKVGKYVPGTGQRILGIEDVPEDCTKVFVTCPWRAHDIWKELTKKLQHSLTVYTYSNDKVGKV